MHLKSLSWKTVLAAGACCALLAACDKPGAPGAEADRTKPAAPEANSAVHGVSNTATASAAPAAPAGDSSVQEVRIPYRGAEGEARLDSLSSQVGKYRHEGTDYLKTGPLAAHLKPLLGEQYETLLKNMDTVGPLKLEGKLLSLAGNRPHQGGEEMAAIVIDPARNGIRVWLLTQGRHTVYTDVEGPDIEWTPEIKTVIGNQTTAPAS